LVLVALEVPLTDRRDPSPKYLILSRSVVALVVVMVIHDLELVVLLVALAEIIL